MKPDLKSILVGAGTGAVAGSVIPGIGTAVGAVVGGTAGLFAKPAMPRPVGPGGPPPNVPRAMQGSADLVNLITMPRNTGAVPQRSGYGPVGLGFRPQNLKFADYGDIGPFPMWFLATAAGVTAWMLWKSRREARG